LQVNLKTKPTFEPCTFFCTFCMYHHFILISYVMFSSKNAPTLSSERYTKQYLNSHLIKTAFS
jgi:hypothetical protein